MAGYIISLDSINSLNLCISNGIYSTNIKPPSNYWRPQHEGTFADYATMKNGDNIYFFIRRKIYGIGELISVGHDCKFNNYQNASLPTNFNYNTIQPQLLLDWGEGSVNNRWLCTFKPNPYFFKQGVDMDDVLTSNPLKFKMLRAFWKLSFVKIDDEENKALKDIILKRNEQYLFNESNETFNFSSSLHNEIANKVTEIGYSLNATNILDSCADNTYICHEMAMEAGLLYQISNNHQNTIEVFGSWDYLSHQVIASPFKAIDYMDKMDIFGYKYIPNFDTISKYLVIELKRATALIGDVEQLMKYVDWINHEYSYGDYSMINAFLVAYDFDAAVIEQSKILAERNYIIGRRPAQSKVWSNLTLVKYEYNSKSQSLEFRIIN